MVESILFLFISVFAGFGMAIALVEKGNEWPIKPWRVRLQLLLRKIYWKLPRVLYCSTCSSFWTTLICDIILCIIGLCIGVSYFLWPLSGFITLGFTWTVIELLNAIDKDPNINVFIDNQEK